MPLAVPKLDDRTFQDIVDEAKKRIPHYCKEWTDHNVSDPGVTLVELFAWMTDMLLYRLNQVPDLHYVKFMEMLGISLGEPVPAQVPVTFWLSAPQPTPLVIPAGTEVASTQTETERSIIFTTDLDLRIFPPQLSAVISWVSTDNDRSKKRFQDLNLRELDTGSGGFDVFSPIPQADDALFFGFDQDLSYHLLGFEADFDPGGGAGVDPRFPPYVWEASTDRQSQPWGTCDKEIDTTKGMNSAGRIQIHLPKMGKIEINKQSLYWVRVRNIPETNYNEGMKPYYKSPRLRRIKVSAWGGTVLATHAQQVKQEFLGQSDGSPGQRFKLQSTPILKRRPGESLTVQVEGYPPQAWKEVPDFASSDAGEQHFTLDSLNGEIRLAPAVRQPDGTIKLYGAIPPRGANLIFESYRYGGGQNGNIQAGIINTLKTSIPYVKEVKNREPAWGGLDAESLESAMMRTPALLRSRERAVSEADYEYLASQAFPAVIGRVKCLQPRPADAGRVIPGQVYLLVIPRLTHPENRMTKAQLTPKNEDIAALAAYMDERRLLTTRLEILPPAYQWVAVKVKLRAAPGVAVTRVEQETLSRLYTYLNPLIGGAGKDGWPFGRDLFASDVYQCLQGLPGVQFIRSVELYSIQPEGEAAGSPVEQIEVLDHGVIVSGKHTIEFI